MAYKVTKNYFCKGITETVGIYNNFTDADIIRNKLEREADTIYRNGGDWYRVHIDTIFINEEAAK